MAVDLTVTIGKLRLRNPVMAASGTFGCGEEYGAFFRIGRLGALITKTITLEPRTGNPPPRIAETTAGMLNSIGLENGGFDSFVREKLPYARKAGVPTIVSIAGATAREFAELARMLDGLGGIIAGIELNLSCPNVGKTTEMIAQDQKATAAIVAAVRKRAKCCVIAKLSPKVTDIVPLAKACEGAGADAISLINTFPAMAVDIHTRTPKLGTVSGGLSGPAIKPIALHFVWEAFNAVSIPVIGIGGIMTADDAVEFALCGATAVQVGTATFVNPKAAVEVIDGIRGYLAKKKVKRFRDIIGRVQVKRHETRG